MFYLSAAMSERGGGHREEFLTASEWEKCSKHSSPHLCASVCDGYLIEQRQTAGYPVLQFDDGDEVALLSLILACVAKRQGVIL